MSNWQPPIFLPTALCLLPTDREPSNTSSTITLCPVRHLRLNFNSSASIPGIVKRSFLQIRTRYEYQPINLFHYRARVFQVRAWDGVHVCFGK